MSTTIVPHTDQKSHPFSGLGIALATPFHEDGSIDPLSMRRLVRHTIDGGVDFLLFLGTTGETPTLNEDEKRELLSVIVHENEEKIPLVIGVGDNHTERLCSTIQGDLYREADALLVVAPFYNKPNQTGLYHHFMSVAEASPKPIILYNIPARTGVDMSSELICKLQRESRQFIGIKEATGKTLKSQELFPNVREDFVILSGDDHLTRELCEMGASGVISVIGNAYPRIIKKLLCSTLMGDHEKACYMDELLSEMYDLLFREGNPVGIKNLLKHLQITQSDSVRLPLWHASQTLSEQILTAHNAIIHSSL